MLEKIEKKVINIIRAKLEIHTSFDRQNLVLTTSAMFDGNEVHTTSLSLEDLADEILRRAGIAPKGEATAVPGVASRSSIPVEQPLAAVE